MADKKLVGENYSTPELVAKVTGRAKYAEDYRAEGMLFARLLLSPMPHARIKSIDTSAALAMPGVKAILTADDVPGPKDQINDNGQVIKANPRSETALANEPVYQGQPVLAVCAVSELIAAEAIELIDIQLEPLPFSVDPVASLMPRAQNARLEGNVWKRPDPPAQGQPPGIPEPISVKWNEAEAEEFRQGRLPMTTFTDPEWTLGDVEEGFKKADLILDETFVSANVSHQCLESRSAMAYWQNGKLHIHCSTQGVAQAVFSFVRWLDLKPEDVVLVNAYTGGGYGSKGGGSITDIIPALLSKKLGGAPVMMRISREEEHAIGRARPGMHSRVKVGFTKEGRVTADGHVYRDRRRAVRSRRRRQYGEPVRANDVSSGDVPSPRHHRDHEHAAARRALPAGRLSGLRDHRPGHQQSGASARHRSGGNPQAECAGRKGEIRAGQCREASAPT